MFEARIETNLQQRQDCHKDASEDSSSLNNLPSYFHRDPFPLKVTTKFYVAGLQNFSFAFECVWKKAAAAQHNK